MKPVYRQIAAARRLEQEIHDYRLALVVLEDAKDAYAEYQATAKMLEADPRTPKEIKEDENNLLRRIERAQKEVAVCASLINLGDLIEDIKIHLCK